MTVYVKMRVVIVKTYRIKMPIGRLGYIKIYFIRQYDFPRRFARPCGVSDTADCDKFNKGIPPNGEFGKERLGFICKYIELRREQS